MSELLTTCQICGRVIKTVRGWCSQTNEFDALIAHHGYRRPHQQGWQTSSCFGARWRPYEFACDAIPPAISSTEHWIASTEAALLNLRTQPPEMLTIKREHGPQRGQEIIVTRPDGFDGTGEPKASQAYSYEAEFWARHYDLNRTIRYAKSDLQKLNRRLAEWPNRAGQVTAQVASA